jgi:hypothetical protein
MANLPHHRSSRGFFWITIIILYAFSPLPTYYILEEGIDSGVEFSSLSILQDDSMAPTIHNWSYSEVVADEYFLIWANVTDDVSGVKNVTATADVISGEANGSEFLLEFNGSLYITHEAILTFDNTYRLWVASYDNALNYRISYGRIIDLIPTNPEDITKDPNLTMPYVVGSTIALLAVILLVSIYYTKTKKDSA